MKLFFYYFIRNENKSQLKNKQHIEQLQTQSSLISLSGFLQLS